MRLTELKPQFLTTTPDGKEHTYVDTIAEAQGILFLCPKCFVANGGSGGTHAVICWSSSRGVGPDVDPKPGRWVLSGTGYGDLTLDGEPGKSRSVLLTGGCQWHGFVTAGEVTSC